MLGLTNKIKYLFSILWMLIAKQIFHAKFFNLLKGLWLNHRSPSSKRKMSASTKFKISGNHFILLVDRRWKWWIDATHKIIKSKALWLPYAKVWLKHKTQTVNYILLACYRSPHSLFLQFGNNYISGNDYSFDANMHKCSVIIKYSRKVYNVNQKMRGPVWSETKIISPLGHFT